VTPEGKQFEGLVLIVGDNTHSPRIIFLSLIVQC
jgi:hypothetical protein